MTEEPPQQVELQRVRNRIIESLGLISSFERQLRYEIEVPIANVPAETLCGWSDFVDREWFKEYRPPVFSSEEVEAMIRSQSTFEAVCEELPSPLPPLKEIHKHPGWQRLREAAATELQVFAKRGRLSEGPTR